MNDTEKVNPIKKFAVRHKTAIKITAAAVTCVVVARYVLKDTELLSEVDLTVA